VSEEDAMKTAVILSLAAVLAAGCTSAPIADTELGLSKGSVFDVPTPPAVKANERAPGEGPLVPRSYLTAPPRIPHAVADFLPITRAQNACLDCHGTKEKKPGEPTPIPPSHYTDFRLAPDRVGDEVAGARYVCVSCHAATSDVPSLIGNRFQP
jgi:nitrate reductase (cytochrome), electron transfer subunit